MSQVGFDAQSTVLLVNTPVDGGGVDWVRALAKD